jgi:tetratricopeptide (TPR) repeat protein
MKKIVIILVFLFLSGWQSQVFAEAAEEEKIPDLEVTETESGRKVDLESAKAHLKRAQDYFQLEALDKAQEEYQQALKANPGSAAAHFGLGYCQEMKNNVRGAIKEYLAAKRLDSKHFDASSRLADIYVSMGIFDKAIQEYRSALEIDPRYSQGLIKIGLVYRKQGMLEEAAEAFRTALVIDPESKIAIYNFAGCQKDRGNIREACEELDRLKARVKNSETKRLVDKILIDLCTAS